MSTAVEKVVSVNDPSDSDEDDWDDGIRHMNKEESRRYHSAALKSDGFDVPYFPDTFALGRIEPIMSSYFAEEVREMAQAAIEHYNKANGCNYEIVKIKKANHQVCQGKMYYVTFDVKPAYKDHPTTTFQAQVLQGLPHKPLKIFICRPELEEHKYLNSLEGVLVEDLN